MAQADAKMKLVETEAKEESSMKHGAQKQAATEKKIKGKGIAVSTKKRLGVKKGRK